VRRLRKGIARWLFSVDGSWPAALPVLCRSRPLGVSARRRHRPHAPCSQAQLAFCRSGSFQQVTQTIRTSGVLIEEPALDRAKQESSADADERCAKRELAEGYRDKQDQILAMRMAESIPRMFPGCPLEEARAIARHTCVRGSGRVGRTAAGRALEEEALRAAVIAAVRHRHTKYDRLLMRGVAGWKPETLFATRLIACWKAGAVRPAAGSDKHQPKTSW
jgi:hypothetical protein